MCKPFSMSDFAPDAMNPFFQSKEKVWDLVSDKGFAITDIPSEDGFFYPDTRYGYLDRNGDTLVCAHIDTVCEPTRPELQGHLLHSSAVDNRLGLYIALELLDRQGIACDILVTDHEEMVMSSARFFTPPLGRKYNFAFSFDRKGDGAVLYQYFEEGGVFNDALEAGGFSLDIGSYSDICELSHLGCRCVNFGVGYGPDYHQNDAYADLSVTIEQLNRAARFWRKHHRRRFPHDPSEEFHFETLMV